MLLRHVIWKVKSATLPFSFLYNNVLQCHLRRERERERHEKFCHFLLPLLVIDLLSLFVGFVAIRCVLESYCGWVFLPLVDVMVVDKKRVIVGVVGLVLVERRRWFSGKKREENDWVCGEYSGRIGSNFHGGWRRLRWVNMVVGWWQEKTWATPFFSLMMIYFNFFLSSSLLFYRVCLSLKFFFFLLLFLSYLFSFFPNCFLFLIFHPHFHGVSHAYLYPSSFCVASYLLFSSTIFYSLFILFYYLFIFIIIPLSLSCLDKEKFYVYFDPSFLPWLLSYSLIFVFYYYFFFFDILLLFIYLFYF